MKLSIEEKKLLYAYGCPNHKNTVARLKWVTSLTVDPEMKRRTLALARKIDREDVAGWYPCFYYHLRMEMGSYFREQRARQPHLCGYLATAARVRCPAGCSGASDIRAKLHLRRVERSTDYEEDMYEEAV